MKRLLVGLGADHDLALEAERGRVLIEESRELVIVLDAHGRIVAASRRARDSLEGIRDGEMLPARFLQADGARVPFIG